MQFFLKSCCFAALVGFAVAVKTGQEAQNTGQESYKQRNFRTIQQIYNKTQYPNNLDFIQHGASSVPPGLFAENATGRITPVGNFTDFQDTVEYFFALAPVPRPPVYTAFTTVYITQFTSGCPEVATSNVYFDETIVHPGDPSDGKYLSTLKEIAFWRFDDTGAVTAYDAWIPNLTPYINTGRGANTYADYTAPEKKAQISGLCKTVQQMCKGKDKQYDSEAQCEQVLGGKRFGSWDEVWGDNVICREIHVLLTKIRPDVHCPHVGPTGGNKCVDIKYNDVYLDDAKLFNMPRGTTFMCPDEVKMLKELSDG